MDSTRFSRLPLRGQHWLYTNFPFNLISFTMINLNKPLIQMIYYNLNSDDLFKFKAPTINCMQRYSVINFKSIKNNTPGIY